MTRKITAKLFSDDSLQWCFSTLGCAEFTLDEVCDIAGRYGIQAVELRTLAESTDLVKYMRRYKRENPDRYRKLCNAQFIKMLNTSFLLTQASDKDYTELTELAAIADEMQVPYLRVFGGCGFTPKPAPDLLKKAAKTIEKWENIRQKHGLSCRIALETHDIFSSAASCLSLFKYIQSSLPTVWDVHHTWRFGNEEMHESLQMLQDCIVHVHVKDSISAAENKFHGVLPGQGDVPVLTALDLLRIKKFTCPVSLEWEKFWEPSLPPLSEALDAACASWAKALPR